MKITREVIFIEINYGISAASNTTKQEKSRRFQ
jgi:hypothetical protein